VLRDVEGLSTQQAAEIVGVGEAAFKSRLHQARLRVRAAIGDEALIDAGRNGIMAGPERRSADRQVTRQFSRQHLDYERTAG
jgi:predicted DNA-binding protein (UPF0251 family)